MNRVIGRISGPHIDEVSGDLRLLWIGNDALSRLCGLHLCQKCVRVYDWNHLYSDVTREVLPTHSTIPSITEANISYICILQICHVTRLLSLKCHVRRENKIVTRSEFLCFAYILFNIEVALPLLTITNPKCR